MNEIRHIASGELRGQMGQILDNALRGHTYAISRNRTVPAYLVPADRYQRLASVTVADLAAECGVSWQDVSAKVVEMCSADPAWGPDRTLYDPHTQISSKSARLFEEAAEEVARRLGVSRD